MVQKWCMHSSGARVCLCLESSKKKKKKIADAAEQ